MYKSSFYFLFGLALLCTDNTRGQSSRPGMGAIPYAGISGTGVTFRVWAGSAVSVHVVGDFNGWDDTQTPLVLESNGVWSADVAAASAGQQYKYVMNGSVWRRDPRSARVVHAGDTDSIIYDQNAYAWSSSNFTPPPLDRMVIYELHVGTFNDPNPSASGSAGLDDARQKLDYLTELGVNAVKIMPVTEFPGTHSWGYNPTDLYAVDNLTYGGPDALKRFVDAAHQRGIAVLLDIVHNHYGSGDLPGDLQYSLWEFDGTTGALGGGIYFDQDPDQAYTSWGPRPDYARPEVRDFIKDNARMWLRDYRIDGFRWDATKFIRSTTAGNPIAEGITLIKEINDIIATEFTNKISIAEDLDGLESTTAPTPGGLGYDSDWQTEMHNALTEEIVLTNGFSTNRILNVLNDGNHTRRVIFTESHDEVGHPENNQIRVPAQMDPADPGSYRARKRSILCAGLMMSAPGIPMLFQGQEFLTPIHFYDTNSLNWTLTNTYAGVLRFYEDMVRLRKNDLGISGGLTGAYVQASMQPLVFTNTSLLTLHRRNGGGVGDDVFVVANLSDVPVDGDWLDWPATGQWYTVLNTDDPRYGSDFGGAGYGDSFVFGDLRGPIAIAPWSMMVFSRIPPPPTYTGMALAGTYNGWNPVANMRKVNQHEWVRDLEIAPTNGFAFKFTADGVWTNINWGTGTVASATWPVTGTANAWGGDFSIDIPIAGTYRFTFNSASGAFSVRKITPITSGPVHSSMAVAGNFNGFALDPNMTVDSNGLWSASLVVVQPWNLEFKFAAYGTWNVAWGGTGLPESGLPASGYALPGGNDNIVVEGPLNGTYTFTFDDDTAAYHVEKTGPPPPLQSMAIAGSFNGWSTTPNMTSNGLHQWRYSIILDQAEAVQFKFAANNTGYDKSWSQDTTHPHTFPVSGTALAQETENTIISGPFYGAYTFNFNSDTLAYSVTREPFPARYGSMAVAGTINGWTLTPNMTLDEASQEWIFEAALEQPGAIEFKFVTGGAWASGNWGDGSTHATNSPATGTGTSAGPNIVLPGPFDGTYRFTFNDNNLYYQVERLGTAFGFQSSSMFLPGSGFVLQWESENGKAYAVERAAHPNGSYSVLAPSIPATPPLNTYTDASPSSAVGFYRVLINP
ncbi:MAG: hypothetical protein KDL31_01905 [Kiritimatiellae bacterium]|nr:hypothetical protein [Kiritimatiellia bacterium]